MGWTAGVRFSTWKGIFLLAMKSRPALGDHPASYSRVPGAVSPGGKAMRREADHSPPSSAEVKNAWSYTSTLPHVFKVLYLIKYGENFTFHFCLGESLASVKSLSLSTINIYRQSVMVVYQRHMYGSCPCAPPNWAPRHEGVLGECRYSSTHSSTLAPDGG
jgi:hypothetical protein